MRNDRDPLRLGLGRVNVQHERSGGRLSAATNGTPVVRAAWRDRRCDLCPQQPPPTGEHLSARDTRTSVPFGGFGTCGAVAESPSAAAWREMGPGQLAL